MLFSALKNALLTTSPTRTYNSSAPSITSLPLARKPNSFFTFSTNDLLPTAILSVHFSIRNIMPLCSCHGLSHDHNGFFALKKRIIDSFFTLFNSVSNNCRGPTLLTRPFRPFCLLLLLLFNGVRPQLSFLRVWEEKRQPYAQIAVPSLSSLRQFFEDRS